MPLNNLEIVLLNSELELKEKTNVTYENLMENVNIENDKIEINYQQDLWDDENIANQFITQQFYYNDTFTLKELYHIANYYDISKRKKKKCELIDDIIAFELDDENSELVEQRKRLWFYVNEIKNDNYLSKFIILE